MLDGLKPYPAYKESGVPWLGRIPDGWSVERNGRLFARRNENGTPDLPILEVSLRTGVRVRDFAAGGRRQVMSDLAGYRRAVQGDIAYNTMRMWQGAVGVVPATGLVSPAYVVARPHECTVSGYFAYLFRNAAYLEVIDGYSRGIVKDRNRLYWEDFKAIPSSVPPPEDQVAIVRFIDHADRAIRWYVRSRRRLIEVLEERAKTVVCEVVTRGLTASVPRRHCGVGWLRSVPAHWDVRPLRRCARPLGGMTPSMADRSLWGGDVPWVTPKDMKQPRIKDSIDHVTRKALSVTALTEVPAPAVLLVVRGMILARTIPIAVTEGPVTVNQDMKALLPVADVDADFLALALTAARDELATMIDEAGHGTKRFPMDRWRDLPIPVPPVAEQQEVVQQIAHATSDLARAIAAIRREVVLLKEFQERLIADAVTGKLDVRAAQLSLPPDVEVNDETETIEEAQDDAAGELAEDMSPSEADA
jgi:type I restriction enzyme S subunit